MSAHPLWDATDLALDPVEQAVRDIAAGRPVVGGGGAGAAEERGDAGRGPDAATPREREREGDRG
ncbi:hypothetical protein ACFWWN_15155, partial [Streptomyces sp. NPDC059082]